MHTLIKTILAPGRVLILRTCAAGFIARNNFQWPSEIGAVVKPTSWNPEPICGYGLHGFLYGEGNAGLANWGEDAEWLVIEADADSVVTIDNGEKVKVPECVIAHIGRGDNAVQKRIDCIAFMAERGQMGSKCMGRVAQDMSDGATLTGGYRATLTGGYRATLTGGDRATLTGGDRATLTGGYRATLTGGDGATLTVKFYDESRGQYRRKLYTIGEDGILPGVKYHCNNSGILVRV